MASAVPGVLNGAPQEMTAIPTKRSKENGGQHSLGEKPAAVEQHEATNGVVNIPVSSQPGSFADGVKASVSKPSMKNSKTIPIKTQKQSRPDLKKRSSTATPVKTSVKQQVGKDTGSASGKDEKRSLRSQDRDASSVTRSKLIFDFDYSSTYSDRTI